MSKKIYEELYAGYGKGDTWTMPGDVYLNPRLAEVVRARGLLGQKPIHVLDIGCGAGINSMWVAVNDENSYWTGVDYVVSLELGVPSSDRFNFHQGDILDKGFIERNKDFLEKKDMVIDQGSVLAGLEGKELRSFLEYVHDILNEGGLFVIAVMKGKEHEKVVFPDGRIRIAMTLDDFMQEPYADLFDFVEGGKTYAYENKDKNPLSTEQEEKELKILQVILKKKT